MAMDPVHEIIVGSPVFTENGDEVGRVKELRGDYVKIDAPMQVDYWLRTESVLSFTAERVTLNCDKAHLADLKVSPPADG
ncbi:MAG: DUF2171 domain-containing protein [Dehalococcoidia bacterium]